MTRFQPAVAGLMVLLLLGAAVGNAQVRNILRDSNNIIQVSKGGPGFRSIQAALDSIADATEENPYLVYVAPGVYEEQVDMKPHVDIEGAGEALTRIVAGGDYAVSGASHAELRSLTLERTASGGRVIWTGSGQSPTFSDVTIRASGRSATGIEMHHAGVTVLEDVRVDVAPPTGWSKGIKMVDSVAVLKNVSILATCERCIVHGIYQSSGRLEVTNSEILVDGAPGSEGILAWGWAASAALSQVRVLAAPWAIRTSGSVTVRHSEIHGGMSNHTGVVSLSHSEFTGELAGDTSPSCFSTCGADMGPLDEHCQPLPD